MSGFFKCRHAISIGVAILIGSSAFWLDNRALAATPLNQATIQRLKNTVQLLVRDRAPRAAAVRDTLTPGDGVKTAKASMVELKFNDQSLARIGEYALFRFIPNTRTFTLSNGTAVLLIPPGRGTTRVTTPNAAAGIRGSALFVRYIPETNTTLIGALTNSGIEVANGQATEKQPLQAGQLAVVMNDRIEGIFNFDLRTFYETSDLVKDLSLQSRAELSTEPDRAIASVREETLEAIANQTPLNAETDRLVQNPAFIKRPLPPNSQTNLAPASLSLGRSRLEQTFSTMAPTPSQPVFSFPETSIGTDRAVNPMVDLPTTNAPTFEVPGSPAVGTPPGQTGVIPGIAPGNSGNNPFGGPPGLSGPAPGRSGSAPGRTGNTPGQSGNTPGQAGNAPGRSGTAPGRTGNTPGQSGNTPGQSGNAPGRTGNTPGQSGNALGPGN